MKPLLTEMRPQGLGHILKLGGFTTAGIGLAALGGGILPAIPFGLAVVYQMFRGAPRAMDPNEWESLQEILEYKLSPRHKAIEDEYTQWVEAWGQEFIDGLILPMVGSCTRANFLKDKQHPYHGLRDVLVYDHEEDDLPPLCPHDYVSERLKQREEVLSRPIRRVEPETIAVEVTTVEDRPMPALPPAKDDLGAAKFLLSLTEGPLQPVIIVGLPGSGKGVMAAMALTLAVNHRPDFRYWVFNPKAKLEEAGYWSKAERHYLKDRLQDDPTLFDGLMSVLSEFAAEGSRRNNTPGDHPPFILLIEEVNALTGLLTPKGKQIFKAKITALASLLRGCNMAIWLSGQSVTLEDLGLTGQSNRAMFTAIAAVGEKREALDTVCQMVGITYDAAALSPTGRYWLTSRGHFEAPSMPAKPKAYQTWAEVPNVVDLRPMEEVEEVRSPIKADMEALAELSEEEQRAWEAWRREGTLAAVERALYGEARGGSFYRRAKEIIERIEGTLERRNIG